MAKIINCPLSPTAQKAIWSKFYDGLLAHIAKHKDDSQKFRLIDYLYKEYWAKTLRINDPEIRKRDQLEALSFIRIAVRGFYHHYTRPGEFREFFKTRLEGVDTEELVEANIKFADELTGTEAAIKFMKLNREKIVIPRNQELEEADTVIKRNQLLRSTSAFFNAAPSTAFIDNDIENHLELNGGKKDKLLEFYYKVKRSILKALFKNTSKNSSDIDFQDRGGIKLKLLSGKQFAEQFPSDVRPESPFQNERINITDRLVLMVVNNHGEPLRFAEDGNISSDGKIAYYYYHDIKPSDFDSLGPNGRYIKEKLGHTKFSTYVNSYRAANKGVTEEQAYDALSRELRELLEFKNYVLENPDQDLTFEMTYGSMGHLKRGTSQDVSTLGELSRQSPLKALDFSKKPFEILRVDASADVNSGKAYFTTEEMDPIEIEIERPVITREYAEKIASLIYDDIQLENENGEAHPITQNERGNIIGGYINIPRLDDIVERSFYILPNPDGKGLYAHLLISGEPYDLIAETPEEIKYAKEKVIQYLTSVDINRVVLSPNDAQLKKVIDQTDPKLLEKIHDPAYLGYIVKVGEEKEPTYWAIDYPKLHINYKQNRNKGDGGIKFNDVNLTEKNGKLTAVSTGQSHNDWILNNFNIAYEVVDGKLNPENAHFKFFPSDHTLDIMSGKTPEPKTEKPKTEGDGVQIKGDLSDIFKADEKPTWDKLENQLINSVKATKEQIAAAKEWYENHPLKGKFPLHVLFNASNVNRPNSIAKWELAGITLFYGSDYSDIYHESWHAFTQTFLTRDQKDELYGEARRLTGSFIDHHKNIVSFSKATNKQLEEYLAEDFRRWMLSDRKMKTGPVRTKWYSKIYAFLRSIYENISYSDAIREEGSINFIHEMYEKLRVGNLSEYTFSAENINYQQLEKKSMQATDPNSTIPYQTYQNSKLINDSVDSLISSIMDMANAGINRISDLRRFRELQLKNMMKDGLSKDEIRELNSFALPVNEGFISYINKAEQRQKLYKGVKSLLVETLEFYQERYAIEDSLYKKEKLEKLIETYSWAVTNFGDTDNIENNELGKGVIGYHVQKSLFYSPEEKEEFFEADKKEIIGQKEYDKAGNERSIYDMADREIIYLISSLHERTYSRLKTADNQPVMNDLGIEQLVRFESIWNRIAFLLANSGNIDEMYNRLLSESKTNHSIKQLLIKLGPLNRDLLSSQSLWSKFFRTFNVAEIRLFQLTISETTSEAEEEDYQPADDFEPRAPKIKGPSSFTIKIHEAYRDFNKIGQRWKQDFVTTISNPFIKTKDNKNYLDVAAIYEKYKNGTAGREYDFYKDIGITFENNSKILDILENKMKVRTTYLFKSLVEIHNKGVTITKLDDIFKEYPATPESKTVVDNNEKILKDLQTIQGENSDEFLSFMVQNAEGETQFEHSLNNMMSVTVNTVNAVKNFKELFAEDESGDKIYPFMDYLNPSRNPAVLASVWMREMFTLHDDAGNPLKTTDARYGERRKSKNITATGDEYIKLELKNLSGIGMEVDGKYSKDGVASADADEYSKLIYDFHLANEQGLFEMMRHADKVTSFSVALSEAPGAVDFAKYYYVDPVDFFEVLGDGSIVGFNTINKMIIRHVSAELERVNQFKEMAKDKSIIYDQTFLIKGQEFQLFHKILKEKTKNELYALSIPLSDYLKINTADSLRLKKDIESQIQKYLLDKAEEVGNEFPKNKGAMSEALMTRIGSRAFKKYKKTPTEQDIKKILFIGMTANSFIHNLESLVLFYGDIAQYDHDKEEFQKRIAGAGSTGNMFRSDKHMRNYINGMKNKRGFTAQAALRRKDPEDYPLKKYSGVLDSAVLEDVNLPSIYAQEIEEAISKEITENYSKIISEEKDETKQSELRSERDKKIQSAVKNYKIVAEESNAQGYISFDTYRELMIAESEWSTEHEDLYTRILRGENLDYVKINKFFPTKKLQYFGALATSKYIPMTAFHKFSLIPLIPSMIKGTNAEKLHDKMMKDGVDYVLFKSGSKLATMTKFGNPDVAYSKNREFSEAPFTKNPVYVEFLKDQLKIAPEYKGLITFSTQMRKLIEDGLFEYGIPVTHEPNKSLEERKKSWDKLSPEEKLKNDLYARVRKYEHAIHNLTDFKKQELLKQIGWKYEGKKLTGSMDNLMQLIERELSRQEIGDHTLEILRTDSDGEPIYDLSLSPNADTIERLLNSIIVKRLVKQKVKGESLIQAASTFFETPRELSTEPQNPLIIEIENRRQKSYKSINDKDTGVSDDERNTSQPDPQVTITYYLPEGKTLSGKPIEKIPRGSIDRETSETIIVDGFSDDPQVDKILKEFVDSKYDAEIAALPKTPKFKVASDAERRKYDGSNDLPFYHEMEEDRWVNFMRRSHPDYVPKPGDRRPTTAMKVKIAMQGDFKNLLSDSDVIELSKEQGISKRQALNKLIRTDAWLDKGDNRRMVTLVGTRIPTQGLNSMEFMEVYEFLEESAGNIIIPPVEIVTKSGSDFDIDKLTIMMPTIGLAGRKPVFVKRYTGKETFEEIKAKIDAFKEEKKSILEQFKARREELTDKSARKTLTVDEQKFIYRVLDPNQKNLDSLNKTLNSLNKRWKDEIDYRTRTGRVKDDLSEIESGIITKSSEIKIQEKLMESNWLDYAEAFKSEKVTKLNEEVNKALEPLENKMQELDIIMLGMQQGAYENELIDSMVDILSMPMNYSRLVFPNGTDIVKPIADDLEESVSDYKPKLLKDADGKTRTIIKNGKEINVISPTTALEIVYNLHKHKSNSIGKQVLGMGAVDNTYNTLFNRIGAKMLPQIDVSFSTGKGKPRVTKKVRQTILMPHNVVDGAISLSNLRDADGKNRISDVISQLINGWVDIAKDAWIFNIQGNKEVASTLLFMVQAGVPFDTAVYFVSNPLIREYVKEQKLAKSTFARLLGTAPSHPNYFRRQARVAVLANPANQFHFPDPGRISNLQILSKTLEVTKPYEKGFDKTMLYESAKESKSTPSSMDRAVFLHYMELEDMAKATTAIKLSVNVDTKKSGTLYEAQERINKINNLLYDTRFPTEIVDKVLDRQHSPVASFYIQQFQLDLFGGLFKLRHNDVMNEWINELLEDGDALKSTYPDDPETFIANFRNDFISYLFQNSLNPPVKRNFKSYKGYSIKDSVPVKSAGILKHGAQVKDGVLYVDYLQMYEDFHSLAHTESEYTRRGLARLNTLAIKTEGDYIKFVMEREVLRYQFPYGKIKDGVEFQTYLKTFGPTVLKKANESVESYDKRQGERIYEEFLRDKALDNTFNFYHLFHGKNAYAAQFDRIVNVFNLREKFDVIRMLSSSRSKDGLVNLRTNEIFTTADKLNLWHEELLTLANPSMPKSGSKISPEDRWISEFFSKLPFVASLQSGLNNKGSFSMLKFIPTDKWMRLIESNANVTTEEFNVRILKDFTEIWLKANKVSNGPKRSRGKDLRTNRSIPAILAGKELPVKRAAIREDRKNKLAYLLELVRAMGKLNVDKFLKEFNLSHYQIFPETSFDSIDKEPLNTRSASYSSLVGGIENLIRLTKEDITKFETLQLGEKMFVGEGEDFEAVNYSIDEIIDKFQDKLSGIDPTLLDPNLFSEHLQEEDYRRTIEAPQVITETTLVNKEKVTRSWTRPGRIFTLNNKFKTKSIDPTINYKVTWQIKDSNGHVFAQPKPIVTPVPMTKQEADAFLESLAKDNYFYVYNADLESSSPRLNGESSIQYSKHANKLRFPTLKNFALSYDKTQDIAPGSYLRDVDGAIDSKVKEKIDEAIQRMEETSKGATLLFNVNGYGEYMLLTESNGKQVAPATYKYLSEQLFLKFGFINPGFEKSAEGLSFIQQNQEISDNFAAENRIKYSPEGLPDVADEFENTCKR